LKAIPKWQDYVITRDTLLSGYEMYLADTDRQHPEASPLWRDDFTVFRLYTSLPQSTIRCAMKEKCYQHLTEQGWMYRSALAGCHPWLLPAWWNQPVSARRYAGYRRAD
jgi:hypothetical protein